MNPEEIRARRKAIEQDIAKQMALLDAYRLVETDLGASPPIRAASTMGKHVAVPTPASSSSKQAVSDDEYGKISKLVREATKAMSEPYSFRHISELLGNGVTPKEVSYVLSRFARTGEVKVLTPGKGRRPTEYAPPNYEALLD